MAARYWVGGNANWDATAGTKWATVSGGAGGAAVPTSADDVFFDAASGVSAVAISSTVNAKSINFTGFPGSFSGGANYMNIYGNVTFDTTYTTTSSAYIFIAASSSITSNGSSWEGTLVFSAPIGSTLTIVDDARFKGYSNNNNNASNPVNGANVYITGGTYYNASFYGTIGTATFILSGNVTVTAMCLNNVVQNSGVNTVNFDNGATYINFTNCKFSYISGIAAFNPLTWFNVGVNVILDTSLMTFNTYFAFNTSSVTLLSDLNCTDIVPNSGTSTINGFKINVSRNLKMTSVMQGTTNVDLIGNGIWSGVGQLKNNLTIKSTANITIRGLVQFNTGTFIVESGAIVDAFDSALIVQATATTTFDIGNIKLKDFYLGGVSTVNTLQLNSPLYINGTAYLGASSQNQTINGSPVYIENGTLSSQADNGGGILGTSQIIATGNKLTYLDSATSVNQGQGTWRLPITVNANVFLMFGRFVLSTGGGLVINSNKVENRATFRNLPELIVQDSTTLTNIHKCKFKTVTIYFGKTVTLNEFFNGSPEFKTVMRSNGSTNYNISFTDSRPKTAFHVNVKNCTISNRNQLRVINRDGNSGFNQGILFGESGMEGFPLNLRPTEISYPMEYGFKSSFN